MSVLDTLEICFSANLNGVGRPAETRSPGGLAGCPRRASAHRRVFQRGRRSLPRRSEAGLSGAAPSVQARASEAPSGRRRRFPRRRLPRASMARRRRTRFPRESARARRPAQGAANAVSTGARFDGGAASARSSGRALSNGFAAGIRDGGGAVNSAVNAIVNSATRRIRSLLSIHSPSGRARAGRVLWRRLRRGHRRIGSGFGARRAR